MIDPSLEPDRSVDAIGALSRIGPQTVKSALGLAAAGEIFDLGLPIDSTIPHNPDFVRFSMAMTHTPEVTGAASPFQYCLEAVHGPLHIGTHIDAFVHIQDKGEIYGGHTAASSRDDRGWKRHGIETVPPIVGRGIMLDIPTSKGLSRLPDRYEVTVEDIRQELNRTGLAIKTGDIVLVRTGKIQDFGDEGAFQAAEPGVGRDAAIWLYEAGMSVLCTDTTGTEPLPFADPAKTTHVAMLVHRGVHLIENVFLEDLCTKRVYEGLSWRCRSRSPAPQVRGFARSLFRDDKHRRTYGKDWLQPVHPPSITWTCPVV